MGPFAFGCTVCTLYPFSFRKDKKLVALHPMWFREESVISFIKQHWLAYVIGIAVAVLLGLGMSYVLGAKWSTPENIRQERIAKEQQDKVEADNLTKSMQGGSSVNPNDPS